jgi:membrane protease YdiL (CAAX protease family)
MNTLLNTGSEFWISAVYICLAFVLYYIVLFFLKKGQGENRNNTKSVLIGRFCGVVLFGIIPACYLIFERLQLSEYGINSENLIKSLYAVILILPVIFVVVYINAKKEQNLKHYPEIRKQNWSKQLVIISAFSWLAYIFAYEFLFRGFFLFISLQYFSYWPAPYYKYCIVRSCSYPERNKRNCSISSFRLADMCYHN